VSFFDKKEGELILVVDAKESGESGRNTKLSIVESTTDDAMQANKGGKKKKEEEMTESRSRLQFDIKALERS